MKKDNIEIKYPIGLQSFSEIIEGGYVYVDKIGADFNTDKRRMTEWMIEKISLPG